MTTKSRTRAKKPTQVWDFFIAHASPDKKAAAHLRDLLQGNKGKRVFLDSAQLVAGDPWQSKLKQALSQSRVTVVLISKHTPDAWYQQEEVVMAIELARAEYVAHTIVPVYLKGARKSHSPYGLRRLLSLREGAGGLEDVAKRLLDALPRSPRGGPEALAGSVRRMDELWSRAEKAYGGRGTGVPEQYRRRFVLDGGDFVARDAGHELKRITRRGLRRRLGAEQMEYIEVLERSMEVNKVLWKKAYPRRTSSKRDLAKMKKAVHAMAADLSAVLDTVESAGFYLDDHYLMIRHILDGSAR
jgi:hypothetical protein